jgi:hypothetical protein
VFVCANADREYMLYLPNKLILSPQGIFHR